MSNVISFGRAALANRLPFVKYNSAGDELDLWASERTGDYSADCQTGRTYARALVGYMQSYGSHK